MIVLFVQSIQDNGISAPMMSIAPKQNPSQLPQYYGGVFLQQGIFGLVSSTLTWGALRVAGTMIGGGSIVPLALPLAFVVFFSQGQEFLRRYFFTINRPAVGFAGDAIRQVSQVLTLGVLLFVFHSVASIYGVLWIIAATAGLSTTVCVLFLPKLSLSVVSLRRTARVHWQFSRWLVSSAVVQWMSGDLFVVAAAAQLGVVAVGALKAAQSLVGIMNILFQGLQNVVPVRAAECFHEAGPRGLLNYLRKVTIFGLAVTICIGAVLAVEPALWYRLVYGHGYVAYSNLLRWFTVLNVIIFLAVPVQYGLRAIEKTRPIFVGYVAAAVFALTLALPVVRGFGVDGVVVGMAAVQVIRTGIMGFALAYAIRSRAASGLPSTRAA
jgi:O-antigen/teichoic acid export membrane protein